MSLRVFNIIYGLLLIYTVSAMVFWGFSLNSQSQKIYDSQLIHLRSQIDSAATPETYNKEKAAIEDKKARRTKQYLGEGSTFLIVIFIGAIVVYSSFRRSIQLSRQQNNFMLAVTHELKSPLAAIKLNLQTLEKYDLDEAKRQQLIAKSIAESSRLNDLCNNMLLASQMEGRQYKPTTENIFFNELVENTVTDYALRYPKKFELDMVATETKVFGDRLMLQLAVNNLLENAVKYAPDKLVHVRLFTEKNFVALEVADEGPGIPDSEKEKVFRKFYRIGTENTRRTKGTGLGLYLTKKIIMQHKGRITVRDNKPSGAVFELQLPIA